MPTQEEYDRILAEFNSDDRGTAAKLLPLVYDELHALAETYLKRERPNHTLQPTALVHEAYIRLAEYDEVKWQSPLHFRHVAAKTMRRILVNHAERVGRQKRGGGLRAVSIEEAGEDAAVMDGGMDFDLIALDEALARLSVADPYATQIVELRFFGGCTVDEVAQLRA